MIINLSNTTYGDIFKMEELFVNKEATGGCDNKST
jgi:hypothetical protein